MSSNDSGAKWTDRDLFQAARNAEIDELRALLKEASASDPDRTTPFDDGSNEGTLLHYAAQFNWPREVIEAISECGPYAKAGVDVLNKRAAQSPLHRACLHGSLQAARTFLAMGADVALEAPGHGGCLHQAARGGSIPVINLILKELEKKTGKKDIDIPRKENGRTPLFDAVLRGKFRAVEHLISLGADASAKDSDDNTPLHIVAQVGRIHSTGGPTTGWRYENHIRTDRSITLALIEKGKADVNATNFHGATPLHYAVFYERDALVKEFTKAGADENIADNDGKTPQALQQGSKKSAYAPRKPQPPNARRRNLDDTQGNRRPPRPPLTKKDIKAAKPAPSQPLKATTPPQKESTTNTQEQNKKDDTGSAPQRGNDQRKPLERQSPRQPSVREELQALREELLQDRAKNEEQINALQTEIENMKEKLGQSNEEQ